MTTIEVQRGRRGATRYLADPELIELIREMATEARGHEPNFTDKERMNLEIYAERQSDETIRDQFLILARGDAMSDREVAVSHER